MRVELLTPRKPPLERSQERDTARTVNTPSACPCVYARAARVVARDGRGCVDGRAAPVNPPPFRREKPNVPAQRSGEPFF